MGTRSKGPLAGFGWLKRGIGIGCRHPKPLFAGGAILMLACMLPSLVTLPIQFHTLRAGMQPGPDAFAWIMAGAMLVGLLIVPLYAGYLQLVDAAEHGRPARARDVFKPYRDGQAWRLIGFGLAAMAVYFAMIASIIATTGGGFFHWYMHVLTAQANHQPLPTALPDGFGVTVALFMALGIFMLGFYAISLGQVALHRRSVFGAIGDGIIGALKNLLPLIVFAASLLLAWMVVAILLVILVTLLALLGALVSPWLMLVLVTPVYIAMLLMICVLMFGMMYSLWRDVCGDDIAAGTTEPITA